MRRLLPLVAVAGLVVIAVATVAIVLARYTGGTDLAVATAHPDGGTRDTSRADSYGAQLSLIDVQRRSCHL